jgi:hypothetical protein
LHACALGRCAPKALAHHFLNDLSARLRQAVDGAT